MIYSSKKAAIRSGSTKKEMLMRSDANRRSFISQVNGNNITVFTVFLNQENVGENNGLLSETLLEGMDIINHAVLITLPITCYVTFLINSYQLPVSIPMQ